MSRKKRSTKKHKKNLSVRLVVRWLSYGLMVVLLSAGWLAMKKVPFKTVLPIRQVVVKGDFRHLNPVQIKATVMKDIKGGYFTVNLMHIRQQLMTEAWVKQVSVRRHWPAQLIVNVVEKKAVAYWNDTAFISAEGKVFKAKNNVMTELLPHMYGPAGQAKKVWMFMNKIYPPLAQLSLEVKGLYMDNRRAWKLVLNNLAVESPVATKTSATARSVAGVATTNRSIKNIAVAGTVIVRLGRYDTGARFSRFIDVFSRINSPDLSRIKVVDMRYPNGFAILRKTPQDKKAA